MKLREYRIKQLRYSDNSSTFVAQKREVEYKEHTTSNASNGHENDDIEWVDIISDSDASCTELDMAMQVIDEDKIKNKFLTSVVIHPGYTGYNY